MAFWKPGTARPGKSRLRIAASIASKLVLTDMSFNFFSQNTGSTLDRATESEPSFDAGAASAAASANLSLSSQRARLPIAKQRGRLLHMIEKHPVIIVVGQTGSGKTTRKFLYLQLNLHDFLFSTDFFFHSSFSQRSHNI